MFPDTFTPALLRQLELLRLRARRRFLGSRQGGHASMRRGHGIEFADYRKYELGDSPRWIDWGLYARTDRLYVRRFQEEENLSVLIILDTSASMHTPATDRKWECARDIAIALGYVGLLAHDAVVVAPHGRPTSPSYAGARAIHSLAQLVAEAPMHQGEPTLLRDVQRAVAAIRFPGIAVYISDFLLPSAQIIAALSVLSAKNLEITAIRVSGEHDANPLLDSTEVIAVDSESAQEVDLVADEDTVGRYRYLLSAHIDSIRAYMESHHISYCEMNTKQSLAEFLVLTLGRIGLLE